MELSKYQILAKAKIGFEVTFLSKGEFNDIINGLKNNAIGMVFNEYDAGGPNICALTKLMDGRYKLETPIFDYTKAKVCLSSFLTYIKNNAKTDDRCFLKTKVCFDDQNDKLFKLNICKFVLNFDEEKSYSLFPDRKRAIGGRSIAHIYPISMDMQVDSLFGQYNEYANIDTNDYGVCFNELKNNILIFQYIGGKGFEDKLGEIEQLVDYYAINTYTSLVTPEFTQYDMDELRERSEKYKKTLESFSAYNDFKERFSKIKILVDLYDMDGQENVWWNQLKEKLYDIVVNAFGCTNIKATINYDTDEGMYQIKDVDCDVFSMVDNVDVIDSKMCGNFNSCNFYNTTLTNSTIDYSALLNESVAECSTLRNTYVSEDVKCNDCTMWGDSTACGHFENCTLGDGVKYTDNAKFKNCKKGNLIKVN